MNDFAKLKRKAIQPSPDRYVPLMVKVPQGTRAVRISLVILAIIIIIALIAWSAMAIIEAFSTGPPYYDRTTNMDKWSNPLAIIVMDELAIIATSLMVRPATNQ